MLHFIEQHYSIPITLFFILGLTNMLNSLMSIKLVLIYKYNVEEK